jgi:hypothetical protein
VLRVRGGWRNLAVTLRRGKPLLGQRRVVVAVDQVVRGTWMFGLFREDRLEQLGRTQLVAVLLVGRVAADNYLERRIDSAVLLPVLTCCLT